MEYFELSLPCAEPEQAEIWTAYLSDFPFDGFEQQDTSLRAYMSAESLNGCRDRLNDFLRTTGVQWQFTPIEERNWNELWESQFDPVEVEGRCVVRAPFHDEPAAGVLDLVIMPKMSFGTGHHATTWLMLSAILSRRFDGLRGLDMGSGTGVLAIAAVKCGAAHVDAVDIDQWAYNNCMENIVVNGVQGSVTPIMGDVSAVAGRSYDFILANINRNILLHDMESYASLLAPSATLIVSGILEADISAITEQAERCGLSPLSTLHRDGWAAVVFDKAE